MPALNSLRGGSVLRAVSVCYFAESRGPCRVNCGICRFILTIILGEVEFDVFPGCICRTVSGALSSLPSGSGTGLRLGGKTDCGFVERSASKRKGPDGG